MSLLPFLHRVAAREDLPSASAEDAMRVILGGEASTPLIAAFLVALRMKGETSDELLGFARAMREKSTWVDIGVPSEPLLDTCGTGGQGASTFNISTVAAFVAAGAGVRVAKHGNRSISSLCGSADLLEILGVRLSLEVPDLARAVREVGIGFLFAPLLHPAMKFAQAARVELKMRTVFNLLGPLTNPARASAQLIGAPSPEAAALMANALAGLGIENAFVVHGSDGLDEVTTTGPTLVFQVRGSRVDQQTWTPEDFGVPIADIEALRGGDRPANAHIALRILAGESGPAADIVAVNAGAALVAAGKARSLREGAEMAFESMRSGRAQAKLRALIEFTNRGGP